MRVRKVFTTVIIYLKKEERWEKIVRNRDTHENLGYRNTWEDQKHRNQFDVLIDEIGSRGLIVQNMTYL